MPTAMPNMLRPLIVKQLKYDLTPVAGHRGWRTM